ncbi:hypothetical protein QJQ45_025722 [Haematococcus lacustris]|nr:hypothetical protein QJQ45_025722 [Haematococcus lacustris]
MQRPLELCSWKDLEALAPIGKEYQQGYKREPWSNQHPQCQGPAKRSKRTKPEHAAEPTQSAKDKAKARQDRDCNAALNMQRMIGCAVINLAGASALQPQRKKRKPENATDGGSTDSMDGLHLLKWLACLSQAMSMRPMGSMAEQLSPAGLALSPADIFIPTQEGPVGRPAVRTAPYNAHHCLSTVRLHLETGVSRRALSKCRQFFVSEQCVLPNPHRPGKTSTVGREFQIVSTYMRRKTLGASNNGVAKRASVARLA